MTWEQFWHGDPAIAKYYRRADRLRKERRNEEMWLQGLYIYEAIGDLSPILQAFAKSGTKAKPYVTEPYPLTEKEIKARKERDENRKREEMFAKMEAWTEKINQNLREVKSNGRTDRTDRHRDIVEGTGCDQEHPVSDPDLNQTEENL